MLPTRTNFCMLVPEKTVRSIKLGYDHTREAYVAEYDIGSERPVRRVFSDSADFWGHVRAIGERFGVREDDVRHMLGEDE